MSKVNIAEILKVMPVCDGERSIREYFEQWDIVANALGLDRFDSFRILPACLKGKALRVFKQYIEGNDEIGSWQEMVDELSSRLTTEGSQMKAKAQLNEKKKASESYEDYADRIRSKVRMAYPEFLGIHQEVIMIDQFSAGIPSKLSRKMAERKFESLNHALEFVEHLEAVDKIRPRNELEKKVSELVEKMTLKMNLDERKEKVNAMRGQFENCDQQFGPDFEDGNCDYENDCQWNENNEFDHEPENYENNEFAEEFPVYDHYPQDCDEYDENGCDEEDEEEIGHPCFGCGYFNCRC